MALEADIVSRETIKPSSPTPHHLRDFKLSLLDELAPPFYAPIVLFYSPPGITNFGGTDFTLISDKLKTSLSDILTLYFPFCGRVKGNASIDCNDAGVLYLEAKVSCGLSEILKNPQLSVIKELLPFDAYNSSSVQSESSVIMGVKVSQLSCRSIALGVCISHKIADGATLSSFLNAWASTARGIGNKVAPCLEAATLFPPRGIAIDKTPSVAEDKAVVTRRLIFNGESLSRLRAKISFCNPTRVEAVTALIWKSAMEAAIASSPKQTPHRASMVAHLVGIRNRMLPPLPENAVGNLWLPALSPAVEVDKMAGFDDLVKMVKKTISQVDGNFVGQCQGDPGRLIKVAKSLNEAIHPANKGGIPCYGFNSWMRFDFYDVDFGWGKPSWVNTPFAAIKNLVMLVPKACGDGMEAWVNLVEHEMAKFDCNEELLQFASLSV